MRLKVKINVLKPLKRVVEVVDKDGVEKIEVIKYERLLYFCYIYRLIGHIIKTCKNNNEGVGMNDLNLQYGSWMRAPIVNPNQERGMRRNSMEIGFSNAQMNKDKDESQTNSREESG